VEGHPVLVLILLLLILLVLLGHFARLADLRYVVFMFKKGYFLFSFSIISRV
jgi:hypothetical protein